MSEAARIPDCSSERRLLEIRRRAEESRAVTAAGIRPQGAPFPLASPETGYYGIPLLKDPPWTWEIPAYFFVGGTSGAAAVIGAVANYTGASQRLVRDARRLAMAGSILSPALLIADLGRPSRFLHMLRVFKPQSPMSVGAWTMLGFSAASSAMALGQFVRERSGPSFPVRLIEQAGQAASLALGLPFSNYTGVLLGATSIPVWQENRGQLPVHFGMSGLASAVGLLELMGHRKTRALEILGIGAALVECWQGLNIEARRGPALRPLKRGPSGILTRMGGALSGPLPAVFRIMSWLRGNKHPSSFGTAASISAIAGSLLTRIAWVYAGRVSARDWRLSLGIDRSQ